MKRALIFVLLACDLWRTKANEREKPVNYHRCDDPDVDVNPEYFEIVDLFVKCSIGKCPSLKNGRRPEHAVLALCFSIDFPYSCGFLPHYWYKVGRNVLDRCVQGTISKRTPIATFLANNVESSDWHYNFQHAAIFINCTTTGVTIADQSCDKPFGIRSLPINEAVHYHEIGSGFLNPSSMNFAEKLSWWRNEGLIGPSSRSYHARIEPIKQFLDENYVKLAVDWQSVTFNHCLFGLNGPFLGEENRTRRIEAIRAKNRITSDQVCAVSQASHVTLKGYEMDSEIDVRLALKSDCRLYVEVKMDGSDVNFGIDNWGIADDLPNKGGDVRCERSICFWFEDHKFNDHGCFEGQLQVSILSSFFVKDYELCTEHIDDNIHFAYYHQDEFIDDEFSPKPLLDKAYCDFDPSLHLFYQQWTMLVGQKETEEALVYMTYENCELATTIVVNSNQVLFGPVKEDCYFCTDYRVALTRISPENCRDFKSHNGKWRRFCYCFGDKTVSLKDDRECAVGHMVMEFYSSRDGDQPDNYTLMPFKICAKRLKSQPKLPQKCYSGENGLFERTLSFQKWFQDTTDLTVKFYLTNECSLWLSIKLNGYSLAFPSETEWRIDDRVPIKFAGDRCKVKGSKQVCFRFVDNKFTGQCYNGTLMIRLNNILHDRAISQRTLPIPYQVCDNPEAFTNGSEVMPCTREDFFRTVSNNLNVKITRNEYCLMNVEVKMHQKILAFNEENVCSVNGALCIKSKNKRRQVCSCIERSNSRTPSGCYSGFLFLNHSIIDPKGIGRSITADYSFPFNGCPGMCYKNSKTDHANHIVRRSLINQCGVSQSGKSTVVVVFTFIGWTSVTFSLDPNCSMSIEIDFQGEMLSFDEADWLVPGMKFDEKGLQV